MKLERGSPPSLGGALNLFLSHEWPRYVIAATIVLAIMLLVPDLLNNMILTAVILLGVVSILPEMLRRRR